MRRLSRRVSRRPHQWFGHRPASSDASQITVQGIRTSRYLAYLSYSLPSSEAHFQTGRLSEPKLNRTPRGGLHQAGRLFHSMEAAAYSTGRGEDRANAADLKLRHDEAWNAARDYEGGKTNPLCSRLTSNSCETSSSSPI